MRVIAALALGLMALSAVAMSREVDLARPGIPGKDNTVKILRTNNKAQTSRFVCETFEFKKTNPYNTACYFGMLTSREEGGIYSFANPEGTGGFITVICAESQLEPLRKLAKELDREGFSHSSGNVRRYYRMRYHNADDPNLLRVMPYYTGPTTRLLSDPETNSVYVEGPPVSDERLNRELMRSLDRPFTQVEVAVKIYEIAVSSDGAMGLDFEAWKNGPGKVLYQMANKARHIAYRGSDGTISANTNAQGFYFDYPTAFFDFLTEKGKARILTSAKVVASNATQAQVVAGERILFYKEAETDTLNPATGAVTSDREVKGTVLASADAGVTLLMTPVVGEKTITMNLDLSVNNVLGYDATGAPVMGSRNIVNSVAAAGGDEIVFGGLARKRHLGMTRKVPILGSLPVIGYLVGGEQEINRDTLIVATVSPRVVDSGDNLTDADRLTQDKAEGKSVVVLP